MMFPVSGSATVLKGLLPRGILITLDNFIGTQLMVRFQGEALAASGRFTAIIIWQFMMKKFYLNYRIFFQGSLNFNIGPQ